MAENTPILAFAPTISPAAMQALILKAGPVAGKIITDAGTKVGINVAAKTLPAYQALKSYLTRTKTKTATKEDGKRVIKVGIAIQIVEDELNTLGGLKEFSDGLNRVFGGGIVSDDPRAFQKNNSLARIAAELRKQALTQSRKKHLAMVFRSRRDGNTRSPFKRGRPKGS